MESTIRLHAGDVNSCRRNFFLPVAAPEWGRSFYFRTYPHHTDVSAFSALTWPDGRRRKNPSVDGLAGTSGWEDEHRPLAHEERPGNVGVFPAPVPFTGLTTRPKSHDLEGTPPCGRQPILVRWDRENMPGDDKRTAESTRH